MHQQANNNLQNRRHRYRDSNFYLRDHHVQTVYSQPPTIPAQHSQQQMQSLMMDMSQVPINLPINNDHMYATPTAYPTGPHISICSSHPPSPHLPPCLVSI